MQNSDFLPRNTAVDKIFTNLASRTVSAITGHIVTDFRNLRSEYNSDFYLRVVTITVGCFNNYFLHLCI